MNRTEFVAAGGGKKGDFKKEGGKGGKGVI